MVVDELEKQLGYTFRNKNLVERALTHRSYLNEHAEYQLGHNERLEFLGDVVLEMVTSQILYDIEPELGEGLMSRLRAGLVRCETLAEFAREFDLGALVRMARGEEDTGGRDRTTLLCNAFEAVIGAMYLDGGIEQVRLFVTPLMVPVLESIITFETDKDPKTLFQEWSQEVLGITPIYRTIYAQGTEHDRYFTVEVWVADEPVGWGNGKSKQIAEQWAAKQALQSVWVNY